eukprot:10945884-Ditylum_brightwellii.AAC.1
MELCLHVQKEMWKQQKNKTATTVIDDEDDDIEETSGDGEKEKEMPKTWYFIGTFPCAHGWHHLTIQHHRTLLAQTH